VRAGLLLVVVAACSSQSSSKPAPAPVTGDGKMVGIYPEDWTCDLVAPEAQLAEVLGVKIGDDTYKIDIVTFDDQKDPKRSIAGMEKMAQEGIHYVVGPNVDDGAAATGGGSMAGCDGRGDALELRRPSTRAERSGSSRAGARVDLLGASPASSSSRIETESRRSRLGAGAPASRSPSKT